MESMLYDSTRLSIHPSVHHVWISQLRLKLG